MLIFIRWEQSMLRWCLLILCCGLLAPAFAAVEIIDAPSPVEDERYDLTWTMTVQAPLTAPLVIGVEQAKNGHGYLLRLENGQASWQQVGAEHPLPLVKAPVKLEAGKNYTFTLKRRAETAALLLNHRLVFCAPAPALEKGTLAFRDVPAGVTMGEARYRVIGKLRFGDDFMRPESQRRPTGSKDTWIEDTTWKVAYYRKDNPGQDLKDAKTGAQLTSPWSLNLFSVIQKSTNGFWFVYRGVGPSWVVANPNMVYPSADRYFMEAAVQPESDSEVGIIAAYQDNKNYLLFRWKQRDYSAGAAPKAELVAVIDGEQKVLASSARGFDPGQWYTLRINLGWQRVQALVDGDLLMDAANPGAVEGRIGLYATGAEAPHRLKMNEVATLSEPADGAKVANLIRFDDVKLGEWNAVQGAAADNPYAVESSGKWTSTDEMLTAQAPGQMLMGTTGESRYVTTTKVKLPAGGSAALLFNVNLDGEGYAWVITPQGQKLQPLTGSELGTEITHANVAIKPGEWADLRVEADGPYVALFCNNTLVMDYYAKENGAGRCGVMSTTSGAAFKSFAIIPVEKRRRMVDIHQGFDQDSHLIIWSSAESEWYPAAKPTKFMTPAWASVEFIGRAAPATTDEPGLYWHKGGHYRNVYVSVPVSATGVAGQIVYLASNYDKEKGYSLKLTTDKTTGHALLMRNGESLGDYPFRIGDNSRLVFERRGDYLLLSSQELDTEQAADEQEVRQEDLIVAYRDLEPVKTEMVGFLVTTPGLPAAHVHVESDQRVQDTFQSAPVAWVIGSGTWAVMNRYSCDPQWNWFGGYGMNTPTVWSKYRLDGDQTVEIYNAVKMQFDGALEEYARRFRDLNLSICTDGAHLNSGYTLIRGGRPNGRTETMLLRKGTVVQTTTEPENVVPGEGQSGHRTWFAERIEKRGGEIKVFIDNHLALSYTDPDPLPGGFPAYWTINNGMMIGRTNFSAERMTIGTPRAAAPLAVQEPLPALPTPKVSLNGTPVTVCTFETGLDDWKERPGLTARLLRERTTDPAHGANTCLKVINMYPAGDFSVTACATPRDLAATPQLHLDYCFDPGAQINLYVRKENMWYEFLLTGKEAQQADIFTVARLSALADGNWHHLAVNLGTALQTAITKQTGKAAADLTVQEIVFADWSAEPEMRFYGFNGNRGGLAARYDNLTLLPAVKDAVTLSWKAPEGQNRWKAGVDAQPTSIPTAETGTTTFTAPFQAGLRFFHLQAKDADGKWGASVHIPLQGVK